MSTMKKMLAGLLAVAVLASLSVMGVAEDKSKPINDKCPLSGNAVNADATIDVKVEFCCNNCKKKYDEDPAKFHAAVAKSKEGKCIMNGKDASKSSTLTVGFCCNNCKGKAEKDPKAVVAKLATQK